MADSREQNFANHAKFVPAYHYVLSLVVVVNLIWAIWQLIGDPGIGTAVGQLLAVGIGIVMWYLRMWPLTVQDRLIRLEETLRLREVLPEDLRPRIGELRRGQFVALRFAPDEELPDLVRRILDGELKGGTQIKKAIRNWKADHLRV